MKDNPAPFITHSLTLKSLAEETRRVLLSESWIAFCKAVPSILVSFVIVIATRPKFLMCNQFKVDKLAYLTRP